MGPRRGIVALCVAFAACAPTVDGPLERQRTVDRDDADRLAGQLSALPGAMTASVTVHRALRDPLGVTPPNEPVGVALIVIDDRANGDDIRRTATSLFAASVPEVTDPLITVVVGAARPELATVGPFSVEASSAGRLRAVLAIVLALIAGLAGWIAVREARR